MANPDLGMKYTCFSCATKFYDLKKAVAVCPKCSANQKDAPPPEKGGFSESSRSRADEEEEPADFDPAAEDEELSLDEDVTPEEDEFEAEDY